MIKPTRTSESFPQPYSWQQVKHGSWIFESLQIYLNQWSPQFFGYHLLKLGGLSCEFSTRPCQIKHQIHLDVQSDLQDIQADAFDLPFFEKSIDTVMLMHQLDYSSDPHRLLREVDRVLVDDGYLVISGFNLCSLFGLKQWLPSLKTSQQKGLPHANQIYMPKRIHDWLRLLNYEVMTCEIYGYSPFRARKFGQCADKVFNFYTSTFGSQYFIVARKRTCPLNPIRSYKRIKRGFHPVGARCKDFSEQTKLKPFK